MHQLINFLFTLLIPGFVSAQWTFKTIKDGSDDPYKIAYTEVSNNALLKMENVDSSIVFYIQGGNYCDLKPTVYVDFDVNGVGKSYKFIGDKSYDSSTVFISWYFNLFSDAVLDFKSSSSVRITINESDCNTQSYSFNMNNSKAAYDFMLK